MNTDNININDTVYADFGKYGRVDVREGKVIAITPKRTIRVQFANTVLSFKSGGWERGASIYNAAKLIDVETYNNLTARMAIQRAEQKAINAIKEASAMPVRRDNKAKLIKLLETAIAAVNAIPEGE